MIRTMIALMLTFFAPAVAHARTWPETGGWAISQGSDFCVMSNEFEGPGDSEVHLSMYREGPILLGVFNSNWSSKEGEVYEDIAAVMGDAQYGGSKAVGMDLDGKSGFAIKLSPSMVEDMAAARSIRLYKGETSMDHLNLTGTSAAIAMTRRCLAVVKADHAALERDAAAERAAAERERQRYSGIAKDPFAK